MKGYHITIEKNIPQILNEGLKPHKPIDAPNDCEGVYFFRDTESTCQAFNCGWFFDRAEKNGEALEMVILEVDLTGLDEYEIKVEKYEWEIIMSCIVEPKRLKLVEDYEPFFW